MHISPVWIIFSTHFPNIFVPSQVWSFGSEPVFEPPLTDYTSSSPQWPVLVLVSEPAVEIDSFSFWFSVTFLSPVIVYTLFLRRFHPTKNGTQKTKKVKVH